MENKNGILKEKIITHKSKNTELSIGDKMYKHITLRGIGVYEVCGFIDNYVLVKSTFCGSFGNTSSHPCIIKINRVDGRKDIYKYVEMMQSCGKDTYFDTDDEGNEIEIDTDYTWHTSEDGYYYLSKKKCAYDSCQKIISEYKERIEKKRDEIKKMEYHITELENWIDGIEVKQDKDG